MPIDFLSSFDRPTLPCMHKVDRSAVLHLSDSLMKPDGLLEGRQYRKKRIRVGGLVVCVLFGFR